MSVDGEIIACNDEPGGLALDEYNTLCSKRCQGLSLRSGSHAGQPWIQLGSTSFCFKTMVSLCRIVVPVRVIPGDVVLPFREDCVSESPTSRYGSFDLSPEIHYSCISIGTLIDSLGLCRLFHGLVVSGGMFSRTVSLVRHNTRRVRALRLVEYA